MRGGRKRQRTASRASSVRSNSPASSLAPTEATDKKSKFDRRFKTDTTSDEDVLGMCRYSVRERIVTPSFGQPNKRNLGGQKYTITSNLQLSFAKVMKSSINLYAKSNVSQFIKGFLC